MKRTRRLSNISLSVKLAVSYLLVVLTVVLILTVVIWGAVQSYVINFQYENLRKRLQESATYWTDYIEYLYDQSGGTNWNSKVIRTLPNEPVVLSIVDPKGSLVVCSQPTFMQDDNCPQRVQPVLAVTLSERKETEGSITVSTKTGTITMLYISTPLYYEDRVNGNRLIGAMFLAQPQFSLSDDFVSQVNGAIILTGVIIILIVAPLSFLLARRFMHPLILLKEAAEKVKEGKYTQRVSIGNQQDELGLLAQTFNEMADTIEADVNQLRHQEQALRDMIANIAHDLATPLTAIQGFSEALADEVITEPHARQETAQRIRREVQRLRRMVKDLQQMSSLESGNARLDLAPLDMHTLVDETLAVIEPESAQVSITLQNEIPAETPLVLADSDRITQVLLNLLDNARRHTPEGGAIRIGAKSIGSKLEVRVSDTGRGIDAADLPHIFERFYRADRSRTGATGGSGLGLAIVKAIITAHGGTIRAESSVGKGTDIIFTLPLAAVVTSSNVDKSKQIVKR